MKEKESMKRRGEEGKRGREGGKGKGATKRKGPIWPRTIRSGVRAVGEDAEELDFFVLREEMFICEI